MVYSYLTERYQPTTRTRTLVTVRPTIVETTYQTTTTLYNTVIVVGAQTYIDTVTTTATSCPQR